MTVLSVDPIEIIASKIVALLNRSAPRDLFDLSSVLRFGLFDESEQEMLRKCVVFYSAIGTEETPVSFSLNSISTITQNRIKTDLLPVLRSGVFFDTKSAENECSAYLKNLLVLRPEEKEFLLCFRNKEYRPELLFSEEEILSRISSHPMAIWKCRDRS